MQWSAVGRMTRHCNRAETSTNDNIIIILYPYFGEEYNGTGNDFDCHASDNNTYLPTNNNVIIYQLLIRLVAAVRAKWDGHRKNNNNNKWYALRSGDNGARPVWPP